MAKIQTKLRAAKTGSLVASIDHAQDAVVGISTTFWTIASMLNPVPCLDFTEASLAKPPQAWEENHRSGHTKAVTLRQEKMAFQASQTVLHRKIRVRDTVPDNKYCSLNIHI